MKTAIEKQTKPRFKHRSFRILNRINHFTDIFGTYPHVSPIFKIFPPAIPVAYEAKIKIYFHAVLSVAFCFLFI